MKRPASSLKAFKCLVIAIVFAVYSVGFNPVSLEARDNRVRTGVNVLSPQELESLNDLYTEKDSKNLYESDSGFQQQVHAAQGRQQMSAIQQVRDTAAQAAQGEIQSTFLRNVKEIKKLIEDGKIQGDPYAAIARSSTETENFLQSQIARLQASGDTSPETRTAIQRLERSVQGVQLFASIAATVDKYNQLSSKNDAAQSGGVAAQVDFGSSVMTEFLTQAQTLATLRAGQAQQALDAMPPLGPQLGGIEGAGVQEHIDQMFANEASRERWGNIKYNATQAIDKVTKINTAVQTIDRMTNSPEYQAIERNEYVSGEAKDLAQTMLAAGEAVQGLASILGADMGNVPAAIFSQAGDGIKSIGLAVGFGGKLEEIKHQGGRGGIEGEFSGQREDFQASGMRVLESGATGELIIPDGSGDKAGDVMIPGSQLQTLQAAVSAFTSLTGRNPTQQELNTLAAGGYLDVGGGSRMGMNQLADPHNRTDFDIKGGERAQLDAFLDRALAGVPDDKLTIFDPDTGKRRPMTPDERREVFGEKLEEMNALSQDLYGQDIDPEIFGADVINDGKWTDKMRNDLEGKKDGDQSEAGDQPVTPPVAPVPPPVVPPADGKDDGRDPNTGLTAEERIGIDAANRRRAEEEARKAEEERKKKEEEARQAEEDKKKAEEEQRKKDEEERRRQEEEQRSQLTSSTAGSAGGCSLFGEMVGDSLFEDYDRVNTNAVRGTREGPDVRGMEAGPSMPSMPSAPSSGGGYHHHEEW